MSVGVINVVVAVGRLTRPAELRVLPSGDQLVTLELTVPRETERADSVPVSWFRAPARAADLEVDEEVLVIGRVRRRFFKASGVTQSRTELVADAVVPTRQKKRMAAALERARAQLGSAAP